MLSRLFIFYFILAIVAACFVLVWNVLGLADYWHLQHISFLATVGSLWVISSLAEWIGWGFKDGTRIQEIIEDKYPYS